MCSTLIVREFEVGEPKYISLGFSSCHSHVTVVLTGHHSVGGSYKQDFSLLLEIEESMFALTSLHLRQSISDKVSSLPRSSMN